MMLCPSITVFEPGAHPANYCQEDRFADEMPEGVVLLKSPPLFGGGGCLCVIDIIATAEVNGYNCQSLPGNRYTYTPKRSLPMSTPKKSFGRHHTHFTHSSILVVLKEGKIDSVTMTNVGAQVLVADIAELAKLSTPEERTKLLTLGAATSRVGHEEFEHFLDSLVEAKTVEPTEPAVEAPPPAEPVTPVPAPDVPPVASLEPEPVVVQPVATEPSTLAVETPVALSPAVV